MYNQLFLSANQMVETKIHIPSQKLFYLKIVALHVKAISLQRLCFNCRCWGFPSCFFCGNKINDVHINLIKLFSLMTCLKNGAEINFVLCTMYFSLQQELCTFTYWSCYAKLIVCLTEVTFHSQTFIFHAVKVDLHRPFSVK